MSATTARQHTPLELTYHGTSRGVAVFSAPSASRPGQVNWAYLDTATGQVACECAGAQHGRRCWHEDLAPLAYALAQVAPFVAGLGDEALAATGAKAGATVAAGAATTTDAAVYWACKREWCRRRRAAAVVPAPKRRLPRGCPDCGEPTTEEYLCRACMADLMAQRAGQVMGVAA